MVDYILKIDIDESDLVRKLNSALKKAQAFSGGGSGSTFGANMGGMAKTVAGGGAGATITEPGMKRIAEYQAKQQAFREGQANTLLLDNELKIGRKADSHAKTMERIGAVQNNWTKKMFNIGTVVKLAGLATGVAGLLQMRKMVIDSSPMLQAMLKLLNVGIMFILRPIGDFFGFVLRPLLVPFILLASQFYASRLGLISEVGTDAGEALLEGDIATLLDRLSMLPSILLDDPEKTKEELEKRKQAEEEGTTFWDDVYNIMKLVNPQLQIFKLQIASWQALFSQTTIPNPAYPFGGEDCPYKYPGGPPGKGDFDPSLYDTDTRGTTDETGGTNYKVKLQETLGISDSPLQTDVEKNDPFKNQQIQENWMEIERQLEELNKQSLKREFDRLIQVEHEGIQYTQEVIDLLRTNETKELFKSGGYQGNMELLNKLQLQIETEEKIFSATEEGSKEQKQSAGRLGELVDAAQREAVALNEVNGNLQDIVNGFTQMSINLGNIQSGGSSFNTGGSSGGSDTMTPAQKFAAGKNTGGMTGLAPKSPSYSGKEKRPADMGDSEGMAGGGVISEEIFGIGKCSGKKYRFGERGDEAIIPMNCFNSLVGGMGRIGIGSMIGQSNVTGSAVGKFSGISAQRYAKYTSQVGSGINLQNDAQQRLSDYGGAYEGPKQDYAGCKAFYCKGNKGFAMFPTYTVNKLYQNWLDEGGKEITDDLAQAATMITQGSKSLEGYEGAYTEKQTIAAMEGQRAFEGGGTTNNLGGLTINVSGVQNPDSLINEIGPKLLKYLQDNDRRVGIR